MTINITKIEKGIIPYQQSVEAIQATFYFTSYLLVEAKQSGNWQWSKYLKQTKQFYLFFTNVEGI